MSLLKQGITFPLGEYIIGLDEGNLVNKELEGVEGWISHVDTVNGTGASLFPNQVVNTPSRVRILRNETGGVLYAGEIVVLDVDAGAPGLGKATAKSSAGSHNCAVVDPTIGSAGVPDDALFIAFIEGPCKVKSPDAGLDIAAANPLFAAGASGRSALAAATAGTTRTVLGTLLVPITTQSNNLGTLLPCLLRPAT